MKHFITKRTPKIKSKRLNKKLHKTKRKNKITKRGGRKFDNPKYLPFALTYQDITDNADYLMEITEPKNTNLYEINQIYVIQLYNRANNEVKCDDLRYNKFIVKSKLEDQLVVIPVLAKGAKYSKIAKSKPLALNVKYIRYAYKVLDAGYVNFSKIVGEIQDETSNWKSNTPAYQKVLQTKELPDKIKSFYNPSDDKETR